LKTGFDMQNRANQDKEREYSQYSQQMARG